MQGDEIRALRRLQREQEAAPYVFTSRLLPILTVRLISVLGS
jgi:hypothetical protein